MSRSLLRAAAWAALWCGAATAWAAPLTLQQALDLSVQRSALARSARAGQASATEAARAAGQQPDPMLTLGIENLPATGADRLRTSSEDMTMKRVALAQEWVSADKRGAREAAAQAVARREAAMLDVQVAETRVQTAMAYIDAFYATEALRLAHMNEKHAQEALEAGRGRAATAAGGSAEVLALTSALGSTEEESAEARQQAGNAGAWLQRWTGRDTGELEMPALGSPPDAERYVANHPLVVLKERELDIARGDAEVARLNRRPNWTYELAYGQRAGRPDLVSLGVSIPLPVAPSARQDRETAARLALVDKALAELDEARRTAAGEHAAIGGDATRLAARIERYRGAVLVPLQQRTAATLAAYRANQASLTMVFDARHAELEAQRKVLALQREQSKALAQLILKPISAGAAP